MIFHIEIFKKHHFKHTEPLLNHAGVYDDFRENRSLLIRLILDTKFGYNP